VVPKPRDREPLRLKPSVTPNVSTAFGMLSAIAFDDEAIFEADKIGDVGADRNLPAPLRRLQPPTSQETPQRLFSVRLLNTQRASTRLGGWRNEMMMNRHDLLIFLSSRAPSPLAGEGVAEGDG
jgi:hypothetical protein